MIYLIILILSFIIFVILKKEIDFACAASWFFLSLAILIIPSLIMIKDIDEANKIKSQIILMKPLEKYRQDIIITQRELAKVERLIKKSFDKNNPNISVEMKEGVKIYSFLGSSDLGSAEAGNAKKQELLVKYIEKQNEIADQLIYVNKMAYGDEYYKLQQEYAVYANSVFDGLLVRWFSINENYKPVGNINYQPKE